MAKPVRLNESLKLTASRVDRDAGVIHEVKLAGTVSKNGRKYPEAVLAKSMALYEGVSVFVNHTVDGSPRRYQDNIATVQSVAARQDGLYGNLHLKQSHPLYEQILEDAEKKNANIGMSHSIMGHTTREGNSGVVVVEEITAVESVDLVANPATTNSLFEQADEHKSDNHNSEDNTMSLEKVTEQELRKEREDLVEAIEKPLKERVAELEAAAEVAKIKEEEKAYIEAIDKMVTDAGLTTETVGEKLLEVCYSADDQDIALALITERAEAVKEAAKGSQEKLPTSRGKGGDSEGESIDENIDAKQFADTITS